MADKIEKNEMGGACSALWGIGEAYSGFWWGNLRERDHLGDPGVDGRIILRWVFRKWDVGVSGTYPALFTYFFPPFAAVQQPHERSHQMKAKASSHF